MDHISNVYTHPFARNLGFSTEGVTPDQRYAVLTVHGATPEVLEGNRRVSRGSKSVVVLDLNTFEVRPLVKDIGFFVRAKMEPGSWLVHVHRLNQSDSTPLHQVFDLRSQQEIWSRHASRDAVIAISSDQTRVVEFDRESNVLTIWSLENLKVLKARHLDFLPQVPSHLYDLRVVHSRIILRYNDAVVNVNQGTLDLISIIKGEAMRGLGLTSNSSTSGHLNYVLEDGVFQITSFLSGRTWQSFPVESTSMNYPVFDPKTEHLYVWNQTSRVDFQKRLDVYNMRTKQKVLTVNSDVRIVGIVVGGPLLGVLKEGGQLEWYDRMSGSLVPTKHRLQLNPNDSEFDIFDMTSDGRHANRRNTIHYAPSVLTLKTDDR